MNIEQGYFSLVRWCPDIKRDECRNLGVVLVDEEGKRGGARCVSPSMLPAVIANHGFVSEWLNSLTSRSNGESRMSLAELKAASSNPWRSLLITEPRPTAVLDGDWERSLTGLWAAYAKPAGHGFDAGAVQAVEKALKSLIKSGVVHRDYVVPTSRTGVPRTLDFFSNSSANTALEVLKLALTRPKAIIERADAEANKLRDIETTGYKVIVYCDTAARQSEATEQAASILRDTGADVVTDIDQAIDRIQSAAHRNETFALR